MLYMADSERYICKGCGAFVAEVAGPSQTGAGGECGRCGGRCIERRSVGGGNGRRKRTSAMDARTVANQADPVPDLLEEAAQLAEAARDAVAGRDRAIVALFVQGLSLRAIGRAVGMTAPAVQHIVRRDHLAKLPEIGDEPF